MDAPIMTAASTARAGQTETGARAPSRGPDRELPPEQSDRMAGRALMAILCFGTLLWAAALAMLVL
jgi:hypothetical protein